MILPYIARHKRLTIVAGMLLVIATAALLWLRPGALGLYHQVKGGSILAGVIQPLQKTHPGSFACQLGPLTEPSTRSRLKQAISHLEASQKYDARLAQTDLLLGRAYCLDGQLENAVNAYRAYTRLRPQNPLGHVELGVAYEGTREYKSANEEWITAGFTAKDFQNLAYQAAQTGQYSEQRSWYHAWLQTEPEGIDSFANTPDPQSLMVFESFVDTKRWRPCSWCNNLPGSFQTQDGILDMSFQNRLGERNWFAYVSDPNLNIQTFTALALRIKGKPGTALTIEIVLDHARSRPISYQLVPSEWTTWIIPVHGKVLEEILVGIPEPKAVESQNEYQLSVDWIALK